MKMQRSTAIQLINELAYALDFGESDIIQLSDRTKALMSDALARDELSEAIGHESAA